MKATTKDLRLHTNVVLAAVDRGEEVVITYRGRCRAVLSPWQADQQEKAGGQRNPAYGIWADRAEDVSEQVRRLREPRSLP
jgi:antitoxin (DNA-binding transcriptional repressor) of toxin-antitoxin stability system